MLDSKSYSTCDPHQLSRQEGVNAEKKKDIYISVPVVINFVKKKKRRLKPLRAINLRISGSFHYLIPLYEHVNLQLHYLRRIVIERPILNIVKW